MVVKAGLCTSGSDRRDPYVSLIGMVGCEGTPKGHPPVLLGPPPHFRHKHMFTNNYVMRPRGRSLAKSARARGVWLRVSGYAESFRGGIHLERHRARLT